MQNRRERERENNRKYNAREKRREASELEIERYNEIKKVGTASKRERERERERGWQCMGLTYKYSLIAVILVPIICTLSMSLQCPSPQFPTTVNNKQFRYSVS